MSSVGRITGIPFDLTPKDTVAAGFIEIVATEVLPVALVCSKAVDEERKHAELRSTPTHVHRLLLPKLPYEGWD